MAKIKLQGFPTEVGEYIELPPLKDLLRTPMFANVDADFAYKHGNDLTRYLLNNAPIKNDKKNVVILSQIQYLTQKVKTFPSYKGIYSIDGWHMDTNDIFQSPENSATRVHVLSSSCAALTEFNTSQIEIDLPLSSGPLELADFLRNNPNLGLIGQKIEPNKFHTFNQHVHRGTISIEPEFRFFFRIAESDSMNPNNSHIMRISRTFIDTGSYPSVEHVYEDDKIVDVKVYKNLY